MGKKVKVMPKNLKQEDNIPVLPKTMQEDAAFPRSSKQAIPAENTASVADNDIGNNISYVTSKDITEGSLVLGVIRKVKDDELEVDLPFHLSGYISRVHAAEEGIKMGRMNQWSDPKKRFRRGQLVIAAVLQNDAGRIQLTIRPSILNAGLTINTVKVGMWLPCAVISFEEFGCSVSLGVDDVKVYVKRPEMEETQASRQWALLKPGSITEAAIVEINTAARTITCSVNPTDAKMTFSESLDRSILRAGFLVEGRVSTIISKIKKPSYPPQAVTATFCRVLHATIPGVHSTRAPANENATLEDGKFVGLKQNDTVITRISVVIPSRNIVFGSFLKHLTSWSGPLATAEGFACVRCSVGTRLSPCKVAAVDGGYAARLVGQLNKVPIMADVARIRCLDTAPDSIPLEVGDVVNEARVVSKNLFEMAVSATTAPSHLAEKLLLVADLKPGQLVDGEIISITHATIFVKVSSHITVRLPKDQATDVPLADLPPKFKVGYKLKCRVLYIDSSSDSVYVTAKKSLVEDEEPLVDFTQDCFSGKIARGVVQKITTGSPIVMVRFYGGITGTLATEEFEQQNLANKMRKGCVVQCRIVEADHITRRLKLSLDLSSKSVNSRSPLRVCSDIMQTLGQFRREKRSAVEMTDVFNWLKDHVSPDVGQILAPMNLWKGHDLYVFFPRELRSFAAAGTLITKILPLNVTDDYLFVLFVTKRSKIHEVVEEPEEDSEDVDDVAEGQKGKALTVGAIPVAHLSDDLEAATNIKSEIQNELKNKKSLSSRLSTLLSKAVLLSPYGLLDRLQKCDGRICLPILSLKESLIKSTENGSFIRSMADLSGAEMTIRPGYVVKALPGGILVSMGAWYVRAFVPHKHLSDQVVADIPAAFPIGKNVTCKVLQVSDGVALDPTSSLSPCIVSLNGDSVNGFSSKNKESLQSAFFEMEKKYGPLPTSVEDLVVGKDYPAVIENSKLTGVFIRLSEKVQARIALSELATTRIQPDQVPTLFPVGRILPSVRVLGVGMVTLKGGKPAVDCSYIASEKLSIQRSQIKEKDVLGSVVKAAVENGLILAIEDSSLEAFCHWKNISDEEDLTKDEAVSTYPVGERVAAFVTEVAPSSRRISVSLRASAFPAGDSEIVTLQEKLSKCPPPTVSQAETHASDSDVEMTDSDAGKHTQTPRSAASQSDCEEEVTSSPGAKKRGTSVQIEEILEKPTKKAKKSGKEGKKKIDLDTDSSDDDNEADAATKKKKRQSNAAKRSQETAIRQKEIEAAEAEQNGLNADNPEEFELLLLTNGNSAAVWIRYMAYYLKMQDIDRARAVAERGVRKVSMKEEGERFNLWLAYLNLEAQYGSEMSLEALVRRALQYNNAKKLLLQLTYLHQRRGDHDQCIAACQACTSKYPESKKMWIRYLSYLFEQQPHDELSSTTRDVLLLALKKLPQRKHIPVILCLGRLEYKLGSPERGRTYFEKLLAEHPKRTDIWGQYFDALIGACKKQQLSENSVRQVFEKTTDNNRFKPRQIKFVFTRWLAFEQMCNSKEGEDRVQEKAKAYVESLS